MTNEKKTTAQKVGYAIIGFLTLGLVATFFSSSLGMAQTEQMYQLAGLGMYVAGYWGAVILIKK